MNMQSQLQAAIAAAQSAQTATEIKQANDMADSYVEKCLDDSSVASPVPGAANHDDTTTSTWQPVADVVEPIVSKAVKIKNLDEKAVLVQVKRRQYSPYKHDEVESREYGAGNVNKHLFAGRDNAVKQAISKYGEVYNYVKENTVPWTTGVDMLNINNYMEFTTGLRELIDIANASVDKLCANWDKTWQADYQRIRNIALAKGKPDLADPDDYPSVDELRSKFSIEVRYMPVPSTGDFRVGISDDDKASLQQQIDDAETNAAKHVINQMLDPMQRAVTKLQVDIGDDGSVFRDSLIDNMVEVADRMGRINISDDPIVTERIKDLRSLVGTYANNKDVLRNSQSVRTKAVSQIDNLVGQMAGLV